MPGVGSKHFAYTKKGKEAAAAESRRTGKQMTKVKKTGNRRRSR